MFQHHSVHGSVAQSGGSNWSTPGNTRCMEVFLYIFCIGVFFFFFCMEVMHGSVAQSGGINWTTPVAWKGFNIFLYIKMLQQHNMLHGSVFIYFFYRCIFFWHFFFQATPVVWKCFYIFFI